jgi:hypothetical protein
MKAAVPITPKLLVAFLLVAVLGLVLLRRREGFLVPAGPRARCGIQLGGCETAGTRCMNGYCDSTEPPKMPEFSELPVYP